MAFDWTPQKRKAAFLLAAGTLPKTIIAEQLGVHANTVSYWQKSSQFQELVKEFRDKIILESEEALVRGLSEQIFDLRSIVKLKLSNISELKKMDGVKLISELRKYMETIHKVRVGNQPLHTVSDVNVNYGGKVQIEQMLNDLEGTSDRASVEGKLIAVAEAIVQEHADAVEKSKELPDDL